MSRREEVGIDVVARNMASKAIGEVGGSLDGLEVKAHKSGTALQSVLSGIGSGVGIAGVMGLASAAGMAAGAIEDAVQAASDLNEQGSKVDVVFGTSAASVRAFASTAASSMGVSERAALQAAGSFGNMFTAMGIGAPKAAEMSTRMVKLAGDLASFNNIPVADALEKIRAGLAGEAEPLRVLGVNLSDVTIRQQAMAMGLDVSSGTLDASTRAQAAYALILQQTATAQGDYERTSDSLANKQRTLAAEVENLSAKVGTALIPVLSDIISVALDGVDALGELGSAIGDVAAQTTVATNPARDFFNVQTANEKAARALTAALAASADADKAEAVAAMSAAATIRAATALKATGYISLAGAADFAAERTGMLRQVEDGAAYTAKIVATGAWTATSAFYAMAGGLDRASMGASATDDKIKRLTSSTGGATRAARDYASAVDKAFDALRTKVTRALDAIHEANLRFIDDQLKAQNSPLQAELDGLNAQVNAAQAALDAKRQAARKAELELAVTQARGEKERADAQAALDDFNAQADIDAAAAKARSLETQIAANETQAEADRKVEEDRAKKQQDKFDAEITALETHLKNKKTTWTKANAEILKLLDDAGVDFEDVGKKMGTKYAKGYTAGVNSALASIAASVAKLLGLDAVTIKRLAASGGPGAQPAAAPTAPSAPTPPTVGLAPATPVGPAAPTAAATQAAGGDTYIVNVYAGVFAGTQEDAKKLARELWPYLFDETTRRQNAWPPVREWNKVKQQAGV